MAICGTATDLHQRDREDRLYRTEGVEMEMTLEPPKQVEWRSTRSVVFTNALLKSVCPVSTAVAVTSY